MAFTRYASVEELTLIHKGILVLGSIALAILSWRFIERPFRTRQLLPTDKKILWVALASLIITAIAGQQIRRLDGYPPRLPEAARNYALADTWTSYQSKCSKLKEDEIRQGKLCEFGKQKDSKPALFLWGDSHAAAFSPAIKALAEQHEISVLYASMSSCPPIPGGERVDLEKCARFNTSILSTLLKSDIKHVLLAGRWSAYIYGESTDSKVAMLFKDSNIEKTPEVAKQIFNEHITALIEKLTRQGITVWIARQVPLQEIENPPHQMAKLVMRGIKNSSSWSKFEVSYGKTGVC